MIYELTTDDITIKVQVHYRNEHSRLVENKFMFSYHITIVNESPYQIQLLSRKWLIFDSIGAHKIVEGDGVIGQQPFLQTGEQHSYESWCNLESDIGYMMGAYIFQRVSDGATFGIPIPRFTLMYKGRSN